MHRQVILILSVAVACGCTPLRNVQTERQVEVAVSDTTLVRLLREQMERMTTTLHQTIIEYAEAPPMLSPPADSLAAEEQTAEVPPSRPAPKRIVRTEVQTTLDRTTHIDSISHSRINTATRAEEHFAIEESPNTAGVAWLKWLAISLVAALLILIILRNCLKFFRK